MLLTNCAACAAPLAHDAPRCVRCKTRYCNSTCQHDHWRRGHKQICKKIHRGGNAEQYHADTKYKEAVAVAVEACADDTKGQKCYICLEALNSRTGEGLVRGCACGDRDGVSSPELGVVHVSCLARQAKILREEAEENNLGAKAKIARWVRWHSCSLCEQNYHGVVNCALGWACWKSYVGQPETDVIRGVAMNLLGGGLASAKRDAESLSVKEAELSMHRRVGGSEHVILMVQGNIAITYIQLGRLEEALRMRRDVYSGTLALYGEEHFETFREACNYAGNLLDVRRFKEAKTVLRKTIPVAQRILGDNTELMLGMRCNYAKALHMDAGATLHDLREALHIIEDTERNARRVFGQSHPMVGQIGDELRHVRMSLRTRSTSP